MPKEIVKPPYLRIDKHLLPYWERTRKKQDKAVPHILESGERQSKRLDFKYFTMSKLADT